jgi:hypothetical protein
LENLIEASLVRGASKIEGAGRVEGWKICQKLHMEHNLIVQISAHLVRATRDMVKESSAYGALTLQNRELYMAGVKHAARLYYKSFMKPMRPKPAMARA